MTTRQNLVAAGAERRFADTNKWEDCKRIASDCDVLLDCGANVGQTARNLRQAYPNGAIYSFEPVRTIFEQLSKAAEDIGVNPVNLAVSNENGWAEINLTASPESNSLLGFLDVDNPLSGPHAVVGREVVRVCRLDDWCAEAGIDPARVDLLKMDVQGAELEALRGATRILRAAKIVLLEVAFVPFYEKCPLIDEIEAFLNEAGFIRAALYRTARPDVWADAIYVPRN